MHGVQSASTLTPVSPDPFLMCSTLVGAVAVLMLFAGIPSQRRDTVHLFAVGASAALVNAQIASIHVFTLLVAGWVLLHLHHAAKVRVASLVVLITSALAASSVLVGDLVGNSRLAVQFAFLALSGVALAAYSTAAERMTVSKGALAMITVSAAYGVGQLLGVFPTKAEVLHLGVSVIGRPSGLWPEPDWLGMYCAIGILLAWRLPLARWQRIVALPICGSMWVLAFARGAWLALIAVALAAAVARLVWSQRQSGAPNRGHKIALAVTVASVAAPLYLVPALTDDLLVRLERTVTLQPDDVSGQARIQQSNGLFALAADSPWYGRGLSAAGRVGVSGKLYYDEASNSVASNWILGLWVDSRWLAVPFIATVIALAVFCVRDISGQILSIVVVSSFFSNATFMPVFWLGIGFCLAWLASGRRAQQSAAAFEDGTGERLSGADAGAGLYGQPRRSSPANSASNSASPV